MSIPKILAFSGSARKESWNQKLVRIAAKHARSQGAEVTELNLGDLELPLFNEDLEAEQGTPAGATRFKKLMFEHHGLLIACPEYNSSITPLLKNAIDWATRMAAGEKPLQAFRGKVCGLMAASTGGLGGLRGLVHVRAILSNIGVLVVPDQAAVGGIDKTLSADQSDLQEGLSRTLLHNCVNDVVRISKLFAGSAS